MGNLFEQFSKWRSWNEADAVTIGDPNYIQRDYEAFFTFSIIKGRGGDKTETQGEIRSIPNVTTVSLDKELADTPSFYQAIYKVKFVLEQGETVEHYIRKVLMPGIKEVEGLRIVNYKGFEEVGAEAVKI